jgi:uncharacterized membrane protein (UPF0127 family)
VTYRLSVSWVRASIAAATASAVLSAAATAGGSDGATAALRLDGVPFQPELALTSAQHQRGLMFRKKAPEDGMLFVFARATTGGFWMKNTLVPLTIVFFDSSGKRVRKLSMTPCRTASCKVYDPGKKYRFALELRASDTRPALRIGPLAELRRLTLAAD